MKLARKNLGDSARLKTHQLPRTRQSLPRRARPGRSALGVLLRQRPRWMHHPPGITGWTLMAYYAPATTAWASVEHITLRCQRRLVGAGHAPLRRAGDGGPPAALHLAQVGVRRLQSPREVNWWFGARDARHDPRLQPHRLPPSLGPKGLLGDPRRDQHRGGTVPGRSARPSRRSRRAAPSTAT